MFRRTFAIMQSISLSNPSWQTTITSDSKYFVMRTFNILMRQRSDSVTMRMFGAIRLLGWTSGWLNKFETIASTSWSI